MQYIYLLIWIAMFIGVIFSLIDFIAHVAGRSSMAKICTQALSHKDIRNHISLRVDMLSWRQMKCIAMIWKSRDEDEFLNLVLTKLDAHCKREEGEMMRRGGGEMGEYQSSCKVPLFASTGI